MTTTRRSLTFATLDDAVRDAENLLRSGYTATGKWTLAQCCFHLMEWLRYPMDGYPRAPLPIRMLLGAMRVAMGKSLYRKAVESNSMPAGKPTMPQSVATVPGDDSAAVAKLKETVERWKSNTVELHPSPLFGRLTKDEAERLQRVHMAHHLGFLLPK